MKARPMQPSPTEINDRMVMPVMIVAEASTMPIWNAAEAIS